MPEASRPLISEANSSQSPCRLQNSGADAEAIAAEMQLALAFVPQRDGELSAQPFPHPLADDPPTDAE